MSAATSVHSHGDLTSSEVSVYYAARVPRLRQSGHEWRGPCPIHGGKDDNFSVKAETGCWYCHSQCGRGSSIFDLEMALTNVDFPAAANEVCRIVGRPVDKESEMKWGLPDWSHRYLRERIDKVERENNWKHTAVYPYFEDGGRLSYVKVRFIDKQNDKTFRLWAVSSKGGWVPRKKSGKQPLLYRLNTLASADEIFLVNGEKAADRGATELGIVTTCAPDGEGHWRDDFIRPLTGKVVRIVIDRDKKGEAHGKTVSEALAPHVREVKVIRLRLLISRAIVAAESASCDSWVLEQTTTFNPKVIRLFGDIPSIWILALKEDGIYARDGANPAQQGFGSRPETCLFRYRERLQSLVGPMIKAQVHDKFKVFTGELAKDKTIGKLAEEVAAFAKHSHAAAKSIGVEYIESAGRLLITLGYCDDKEPYPIKLHSVPLGKIETLTSDFSKLEAAMAEASGKIRNIICHELYLTGDGDFVMVFMTHEQA